MHSWYIEPDCMKHTEAANLSRLLTSEDQTLQKQGQELLHSCDYHLFTSYLYHLGWKVMGRSPTHDYLDMLKAVRWRADAAVKPKDPVFAHTWCIPHSIPLRDLLRAFPSKPSDDFSTNWCQHEARRRILYGLQTSERQGMIRAGLMLPAAL